MNHMHGSAAHRSRADQLRRAIIWAFIIAVSWVPGGVALAIVLTGNAGH